MSYRRKTLTQIQAVDGETAITHSMRLLQIVREYRNLYQNLHETKHFCHYGPHPCFLCPIIDGLEHLAMDTLEREKNLQELGKESLYKACRKNSIGKWTIVPIRST